MAFVNLERPSQSRTLSLYRIAQKLMKANPLQPMSMEQKHYEAHVQRLAETSPHLLEDIGVTSAKSQE